MMNPAAECLLSFHCVAHFRVLSAIQRKKLSSRIDIYRSE
jgi:hypothetical protein